LADYTPGCIQQVTFVMAISVLVSQVSPETSASALVWVGVAARSVEWLKQPAGAVRVHGVIVRNAPFET
jgi:hypothetical protein